VVKSKEHHINLVCAFCGKSQREVRKLIAGPTVYICDLCIKLCHDMISEHNGDALQQSQMVWSLAKTARRLACDLGVLPTIPRWILDCAISLAKELEGLAQPDEGSPATSKRYHDELCCSFCGKSQGEVQKLIAAPSANICDECVNLLEDVIVLEQKRDLLQAFAQTGRRLALDLKSLSMIPPAISDRAILLAEELERLKVTTQG